MRAAYVIALSTGCTACGQQPAPDHPTGEAGAPAIHIVATERGPGGGILVAIDETGDRVAALVAAPGAGGPIRDTSPAFSPDGKWLVFASSRGRPIDQSSLWAVPVGYDATPTRLTDSSAIDMTPTWTPDGKAIVYASSKNGTLDLWQLGVALDGPRLRAPDPPVQLTSAAGQELSPTIAPDGRIAYASLTTADGTSTSVIEVRHPDGRIEALTPGPSDASPRFDPAGKRIAFTRPTVRTSDAGAEDSFSSIDADLWILDGGEPARVVDLPFTDESSPVWSIDGRWLLATSLVRKKNNEPLLSSLIDIDLEEDPRVPRMLVDRAGVVTRLSPAVAPVILDATGLHAGPTYSVDEIKRILDAAFERNEAKPRE